jgi:SAM-dependent methyltransferase
VPLTRLSTHELRIARAFDRSAHSPAPGARLRRLLHTAAGNFLLNTPLFLLPKVVNLQPKHRVLEIGCSRGADLAFLTARFAFDRPPVGVDLSRASLPRPGQTIRAAHFLAASGSRLPFADESFDLVLAPHMLRHLSGEGFMRLLVEANRVLQPGGVLAVWDYAPAEDSWRGRAHGWLLRGLGGVGKPRAFGDIAHWVSEAKYDVIENPDLRPFLFPPVPRVSLLARKAAADSPT